MTEEGNYLHQREINLIDGDISQTIIRSAAHNLPCTYSFNTHDPYYVYNAHVEYLSAGANLIRTNTRQATEPYLTNYFGFNFAECTNAIINAARIALRAVEDYNEINKHPWGSAQVVGSCGHFSFLSSLLNTVKLKDVHLHRIRTLVIAGVRIISLEGIQNLDEAFMLLDIIREFPNVRVLIMFDSRSYTAENVEILKHDVMHCYYKLAQQILAVGISGGDSYLARQQLNAISGLHSIQNRIPLIACIDKNQNDTNWIPVDVQTNNLKEEWEALRLRYIGGYTNVFPEDISQIRMKLMQA